MTPWSASVALDGDCVRLSLLLSTDSGPVRMFREYLTVDLDEAHATMLLGELAVSLELLRGMRRRAADNVIPFPGAQQ